ncbi:MAG: GxxExxY protein [Alphaproteobacteria bacterium]|nr:GxxExxY protein [Alphaproteobacteria bacterium]
MGTDRARPHDALTETIIECIIPVHRILGPGFLESVYQNALEIELRQQNLKIEKEKEVTIEYRGEIVGRHRLDLVVESSIIIELKTVEALSKAHYAQLRSYLAASGLTFGILVNFSEFKADFRRVELTEN